MRTENIDNLTGNYVFLLGAYRTLYIFNWIYRYYTEEHYQHWLGTFLTCSGGDTRRILGLAFEGTYSEAC